MITPEILTVIDELEAFQKTVDNAWNIPREEGMLLHAIVTAAGCREMVEVGTSYGFSGLFLGAAAKAMGGRLQTFDKDPAKYEASGENFAKAGLDGVIVRHLGDAREELAKVDGPIDFAFIDAAKPQTLGYWELIEPKLSPTCVVAIDNIDTKAEELQQLRNQLEEDPAWAYTDVFVGNGFGLAVRRA